MTRFDVWAQVTLAMVACTLHYGVPSVGAGLIDLAAAIAIGTFLRLLTRRLDPLRRSLRPHPPLVGATAAARRSAPKADDGDQPQPPPSFFTAPSTSSSSPVSPIAGPVVPGLAEALGISKERHFRSGPLRGR